MTLKKGDAFFSEADGQLYVFDGTAFPAQGEGIPFQGKPGTPGTTTWAGIVDRPEEFPPSAHTHAIGDVDGLTAIVASHESTANKGVAGGYAPLDGTAHIPAAFIPGSVDDVVEVETFADLPNPGLAGKIYVTLDTSKTYRWGGTIYVEIAASPGSTDAVPEGVINLYYTDVRATAAASAAYETRVSAAEAEIIAINATNTQMAADVVANETAGAANSAAITGLDSSKADETDSRFDLAVSAVQPSALSTAINDLRSALTPARVPLGQRSPLTIVPTITALSSTPGADAPTIDGGVITSGGSDNRISPSGGATLRTDTHDASAYCYQWLIGASGATNIGSPNPTSWSVGFELYGTDEVEFIVNAYSSYFNLTIDGNRVWWTSQPGPQFDPSDGPVFGRYSIKFKLPDNGKYDLRFYMSSMSLESVCIGGSGWLIPKPLTGPRCYFLGDRTTMGFTGELFNTIGSWIYWFANLQGLTDIWNDGQANTGPTIGSHATYPLRATATLVPANPAVVFIQGYEAEKTANTAPSAVAAAISSTIDIARTAPSNPYIVVIGSPEYTGTRSAQDLAIAGAIHTVCANKHVAWIDPESGEVWNAAGTIVKQPDGPWITTLNLQTFVANLVDGTVNGATSLSDIGQSYFGYKVWEAVQLLDIPAMAT